MSEGSGLVAKWHALKASKATEQTTLPWGGQTALSKPGGN